MSGEAHRSFDCFGGTAAVHVRGDAGEDSAAAADAARARLLDTHARLSRFLEDSELNRLNADPRPEVPASPLLRRLATAVKIVGARSGGLVDGTQLDGVERAGYRASMRDREPIDLVEALRTAPERRPARPDPARRWRAIGADERAGTVIRPPRVRIDSGGIAKGLLADLVAATLSGMRAFAVDCCGDIRIGGTAGQSRAVLVGDPFGGDPVHELTLREGAVATSGISRRCWTGPDGRPAHHLIDPGSGAPAFTGIVQATAIAPTGLLAEALAKSALLTGPDRAASWLPHGGVLVDDEGEVQVIGAERPLPRAVPAP